MGSGLGKGGGVVHWRVVRKMVVAWLLTLPAAGSMGACALFGVEAFSSDTAGVIVVGATALILALGLLWHARRNNVNSLNVIEQPPAGAPALAVPTPA